MPNALLPFKPILSNEMKCRIPLSAAFPLKKCFLYSCQTCLEFFSRREKSWLLYTYGTAYYWRNAKAKHHAINEKIITKFTYK